MWLHIGGDLFIWLAYVSIPLVLLYFTSRRTIPYPKLFILFALFILACGFGHLIEALMFDYPLYRLAGVWKIFTAAVSWATVLTLIPVVPRVMNSGLIATQRPSHVAAVGDSTVHHTPGSLTWDRIIDYIVAILAGVLALLVRAAIDPLVAFDHVYVLSLMAVVFVSWQSGFGPAIVTLAISMVGMVYFFVYPRYSFVVEGFGNQLATALFFFCGVCCAALGEAQRIARRRTKAALAIALERKAELETEVARRIHAEGAIRESEQRFRNLADSAPALIWVAEPDQRRSYFNRTWLEFTGRPADEQQGDGWMECIHPDDRDRYLGAYTAAFAVRDPFEVEYRLRRSDGVYRWVLARGTPRFTPTGDFAGFVGLCLDVTDRREAAEAIRRSEKNLADFFENASIGLHWIGPEGTVLRANRAELEMLGYSREEYVGQPIAKFHDNPETIADILVRLNRGERLDNYPARLRCKDGSTRDVLISSSGLWEEGRFIHSRCFTRDVTELKRAEQALAERATIATLRADVAAALTTEDGISASLQASAELIVRHIGAAFVRIWTTDADGKWLEMQASAGMYTHLDGRHARIRVGEFKIGRIAQLRCPYLSNEVPNDPHISDPDWARREGIVAFAGYPLIVEGQVLGVLALFARSPLSESLTSELAPVAESIAQFIERRRGEAAIRASEERFRTLTEAIPQIVWHANADGEATYFNRLWLDYTALSIEKSRGFGWIGAVHPQDQERVLASWRAAVESPLDQVADRFTEEFRLRMGNTDDYRWFLAVAVPLRKPDGRVDQWIGSMTDIHDQKTASERLEKMVQDRTVALIEEIEDRKRAEQQVREVATELERSNQELEQFAYIASHDLQEPLRKIQAFGDRLKKVYRDKLEETGQEYVDRMLISAERMRRLIDDLLTFSRVTTQARPFVQLDLTKLVREVVSDLSERIEPVNGKVEVSELPAIDGDPTQMRQLFQNLIANAVKFQRPGVPPVVEVYGELVTEPSPDQNGEPVPTCRISVRDNGIGFDEKYLDRIFQVFQRLHGRDEYEGTGVGLALCRKIVERHGGTITARSRVGQGSVFIVILPLRKPQGTEPRLAKPDG